MCADASCREGEFVDVRPIKDKLDGPKDTDETTDTYDTIDWLVKNIPNNNGKVGLMGTSYGGYYTTCATSFAHTRLWWPLRRKRPWPIYIAETTLIITVRFSWWRISLFIPGFTKQNNPIVKQPILRRSTTAPKTLTNSIWQWVR